MRALTTFSVWRERAEIGALSFGFKIDNDRDRLGPCHENSEEFPHLLMICSDRLEPKFCSFPELSLGSIEPKVLRNHIDMRIRRPSWDFG